MDTVFDYLFHQNEDFFDNLYGKEVSSSSSSVDDMSACWASKAIFQSLSALSKNYVIRLLSLAGHSFTADDLKSWICVGKLHEY